MSYELAMHIPMIGGALIGMGLMLVIALVAFVALFWGDEE
jgi:hypothetical protein